MTSREIAYYTRTMTSLPISSALKDLGSRNAVVLAAYRGWARRLPPGSASRLASTMAEQRLGLGKALSEIGSNLASLAKNPETEVELELDPSPSSAFGGKDPAPEKAVEPKGLLKAMAEIETAEHELLAAVAGAALPLSSVLAERLAGEAASARMRSIWAQDQLDLLSMS